MEGFHLQKPAGLLNAKQTNSKHDQEERELQAGAGGARGAGYAAGLGGDGGAGYTAEAGEKCFTSFFH